MMISPIFFGFEFALECAEVADDEGYLAEGREGSFAQSYEDIFDDGAICKFGFGSAIFLPDVVETGT